MFKKEKTLDAILKYLELNKNNTLLLSQILLNLTIESTQQDIVKYESTLLDLGYTSLRTGKPISHGRKILMINDKGIRFISEGGFTKDKKIATLKDIAEVIKFFKP